MYASPDLPRHYTRALPDQAQSTPVKLHRRIMEEVVKQTGKNARTRHVWGLVVRAGGQVGGHDLSHRDCWSGSRSKGPGSLLRRPESNTKINRKPTKIPCSICKKFVNIKPRKARTPAADGYQSINLEYIQQPTPNPPPPTPTSFKIPPSCKIQGAHSSDERQSDRRYL